MTDNHALVSVIIPVYNGERYLGEALASVLQQSYRPLEIIVVDDGSQDGTAQVAQQFGDQVRYTFQTQQGTGPARNHGVALARGDFLAFLDADDLWLPHKLQLQMNALQQDPTLAMAFGQVEQFYSPELTDHAQPDLGNRQTLAGVCASAMLIRRKDFLRVGLFDPAWIIEFLEWYSRAQRVGLSTCILPETVAKRRIHQNNLTVREHTLIRSEYLRLMKTNLAQRKLAQSAVG